MIDLGIYNFVKNGLEEGKSKETLEAALAAQGMRVEDIKETFDAVARGNAPTVTHEIPSIYIEPASRHYARSGIEEWYEFRGEFWKYFAILFIANIISGVARVGAVSLFVFVIDLFCLIHMARLVEMVTLAIKGRRAWLIILVNFIFPPAAFYFAYRSAKRRGWDISMNVIEQVVVFLSMISFVLTLVGILLLISAIGLAWSSTGGLQFHEPLLPVLNW
jgi:hypothetical protein